MRIIAKIETKTGSVIKGRKLEGIRKLGDPSIFAQKYYNNGIDEIIFIDSVASLYGRVTLFDIIEKVSEKVFVPLTAGGGIRNVDDCKIMFMSGADKISLNSILFKNLELVNSIAKIYGSQAIVVEVQAKKNSSGYECLCEYGREYTNIDLVDWLKRLQTLPIGEIHLVSVDSDGMNKGVDFELINLARDYVNIPLIYGGGFNHLIDDVNKLSNIIDGLVIASSIHNNDLNLLKLSQRST